MNRAMRRAEASGAGPEVGKDVSIERKPLIQRGLSFQP